MPRGPRGEKRPTNPFEAAIMVGRIATGEIDDPKGRAPNRAKGGKAGGKRRAETLDSDRRVHEDLFLFCSHEGVSFQA
jgi:hypothetical protein